MVLSNGNKVAVYPVEEGSGLGYLGAFRKTLF
jgi:hypothetical protein